MKKEQGSILLITLIISGVTAALILSLLKQSQLEWQLINSFSNQLREKKQVFEFINNLDFSLNGIDLCTEINACSESLKNHRYKYYLVSKSKECCLKVIENSQTYSTMRYELMIQSYQSNQIYQMQTLQLINDCNGCNTQTLTVRSGLQSFYQIS